MERMAEYITYEQQYLALIKNILENGEDVADRTGVGTRRIFGANMSVDLSKEFPILTTRKFSIKSIFGELLWFLSGSTSNTELVNKYNCTIWNEWADKEGNLGLLYGHQWRNFGGEYAVLDSSDLYPLSIPNTGFDQIAHVIHLLKTDPASRRIIISSWDAPVSNDKSMMGLPACHPYVQFTTTGNKLNCFFLMRANDVILGQPYNIASYALLTHMIASVVGMEVGILKYTGVDVHIYLNQLDGLEEQLSRSILPNTARLKLTKHKSLEEYSLEDAQLLDYVCHPAIKFPVAV